MIRNDRGSRDSPIEADASLQRQLKIFNSIFGYDLLVAFKKNIANNSWYGIVNICCFEELMCRIRLFNLTDKKYTLTKHIDR